MIRNHSELDNISKEKIIHLLKEKGLKITPQRLAVIEVFVEQKNAHPGARLIYEEAKKRKKSLSLSTTYATLDELSRRGVVKILQFDRMENRYEGNLDEHVNLICEKCGKILDYHIQQAVDREEAEQKTGFSIRDARLEYYGYCRECRESVS